MLTVDLLVVPGPTVEGQVSAAVDDEVEGVIVAVLVENAAAGEEAVGVLGACARAHVDLPHRLEVAGLRRSLGMEGLRRALQVRQQEGVDEPGVGVVLVRHDPCR